MAETKTKKKTAKGSGRTAASGPKSVREAYTPVRKPTRSQRVEVRSRSTDSPQGQSPNRKRTPVKEPAAKKGKPGHSKGSKARESTVFRAGKGKAKVLDLEGKAGAAMDLPIIFDLPVRADLIQKAVNAARANRRQAYGPSPKAGMRHSVQTWGKGRGTARVQRIKDGRDGAESPNNVGGRRAHPPRPERDWSLKINVRERRLARNSAVSATSRAEVVSARGHKFKEGTAFPLVVSDEFQKLVHTKDVIKTLDAMGLYDDLVRAENGKHVRPGRGKMRGRRMKVPRSVLIVVGKDEGIHHAGANILGVDIVFVEHLSTEDLAPGGDAGRLTVYTKSAIKTMGAW
jgi:large subunit ribosomal protein L4e